MSFQNAINTLKHIEPTQQTKPMIYYFTPYSVEGKLGQAYNKYASLVPSDDDWICMLDGDTAFITDRWGHLINNIVTKYPSVGMFTCFTNRSGNRNLCYQNVLSNDPNMLFHRRTAQMVAQKNKGKISYLNQQVSGLFMLFKKSTWKVLGGYSEDMKILSVDIEFGRRLIQKGYTIARIDGLYLYHYYRHLEGMRSKKHLL
jgi:GT2 family glycosyltransferase